MTDGIELVSRDRYPLIYLLAAIDRAGGRLEIPAGDFSRLLFKMVEIEADGRGGVILSIQNLPHAPTREPRVSDR